MNRSHDHPRDRPRAGVEWPVSVDRDGCEGPTPNQVRGKRWRRVGAGLYVPSEADPGDLDQRIVEASAGCPPGAAVTGWAGLAWLGGRWFRGIGPDGQALDVPVSLGDRRLARPRDGVRLSEDWLFDGDIVRRDGLLVTIAVRSLAFEVRTSSDLIRAVAAIDMAAFDDLVDLPTLRTYVARLRARPGIKLLRRALDLATENVWSPQETRMRLLWRLEVVDVPLLCNAPVFDRRGRHLFTIDLLDPVAAIGGDYDGVHHLGQDRRGSDLDRVALAREHGIEIVTMVGGGFAAAASFERRLAAAYRRSDPAPSADRTWTLAQPDWWVDTSTVAARRGLDAEERSLWLRRQAG